MTRFAGWSVISFRRELKHSRPEQMDNSVRCVACNGRLDELTSDRIRLDEWFGWAWCADHPAPPEPTEFFRAFDDPFSND